MVPRAWTIWPWMPVSSAISRTAACSAVSVPSRCPFGRHHSRRPARLRRAITAACGRSSEVTTNPPAEVSSTTGRVRTLRRPRRVSRASRCRACPPGGVGTCPRLGWTTLATLQRRALGALTDLAPAAIELGAAFAAAGHELALVGGPVRDAFLGRVSTDLDFATSATPDQTEALLARWGDAHWDIGREWGTVGARRFAHGGSADVVVEVTTYRSDVYD